MQKLTDIIDLEDIESQLPVIEKSFNIKFDQHDLEHVKTFGDLCDALAKQLYHRIDKEDCTNQQAFYKLRNAITKVTPFKREDIHLSLPISVIFPKKRRASEIKKLKKELGVELKIFRPKIWKTNTAIVLFFLSIGIMIFQFLPGLLLFAFSIFLLRLVNLTGKEFIPESIGDLTEYLTIEHYSQSRRFPNTINRKEIETQLRKLLMYNLGLSSSEIYIKRETVI